MLKRQQIIFKLFEIYLKPGISMCATLKYEKRKIQKGMPVHYYYLLYVFHMIEPDQTVNTYTSLTRNRLKSQDNGYRYTFNNKDVPNSIKSNTPMKTLRLEQKLGQGTRLQPSQRKCRFCL